MGSEQEVSAVPIVATGTTVTVPDADNAAGVLQTSMPTLPVRYVQNTRLPLGVISELPHVKAVDDGPTMSLLDSIVLVSVK